MKRHLLTALLAAALTVAACGGGGDDDIATSATTIDLVAQVASYELEVGTPQRFLVGVLTSDAQVIGGGTVTLSFGYRGTKEAMVETSTIAFVTEAEFSLLPGSRADAAPDVPSIIEANDGAGVYRAQDVEFDQPGFWGVRVVVDIDGEKRGADATFEVLEDSAVVEVGEPAPKTVNHLPGADDVPVKAVDSRAEDDGTVPDPILHELTVADALAAGRPVVVVISTPVYCVSRFCGPITEEVADLASRADGDVAFVHLEVWRDYEGKAVNKAAAEWMYPDGAEGAYEPWVFVVGADGRVTHRFDNVTSTDELTAAVAEVTS